MQNDEIKCAFCGMPLIERPSDHICVCRNPNCKYDGHHFPKEIWIMLSEVSRYKKALSDIEINHNITDCCQSCREKCEVCEQNREIASKALKEVDL